MNEKHDWKRNKAELHLTGSALKIYKTVNSPLAKIIKGGCHIIEINQHKFQLANR